MFESISHRINLTVTASVQSFIEKLVIVVVTKVVIVVVTKVAIVWRFFFVGHDICIH